MQHEWFTLTYHPALPRCGVHVICIYINPEIIVNTYYVGSLNPDGAVNGAIVVLRLFVYLIPRGYTRKGVRACYNGVY